MFEATVSVEVRKGTSIPTGTYNVSENSTVTTCVAKYLAEEDQHYGRSWPRLGTSPTNSHFNINTDFYNISKKRKKKRKKIDLTRLG